METRRNYEKTYPYQSDETGGTLSFAGGNVRHRSQSLRSEPGCAVPKAAQEQRNHIAEHLRSPAPAPDRSRLRTAQAQTAPGLKVQSVPAVLSLRRLRTALQSRSQGSRTAVSVVVFQVATGLRRAGSQLAKETAMQEIPQDRSVYRDGRLRRNLQTIEEELKAKAV